METERETSVTGSKIEVNRADGRSHGSGSYAGSLTGSEQAAKPPLKKPEWVQRSSPRPKKSPDRSSDKSKLVQRSPPGSTKSPDRISGKAADDVKDLKGALRGLGGTKGQGHVTFQLPSSPGKSPSKALVVSPKQSDSPVKKPRMLPRVAEIAKQSSSSPRIPRHTSSVPLPSKRENYIKHHKSPSSQVSKESNTSSSFSGSSLKRKKSPRSPEAVNSRGQKNPPSPRVSKEPYKSPSLSGSSSLTRKKTSRPPEAVDSHGNNNPPCPRVSKEQNKSPSVSGSHSSTTKKPPRSSETVNSCGNSSSGDNSVIKRNTDTSIIVAKQESPRKTQLDTVQLLEEIVTLREQVGEDGEVTYHIPKQQFEDLSKGVHDVLHDLQSIKLALNIQDNGDE